MIKKEKDKAGQENKTTSKNANAKKKNNKPDKQPEIAQQRHQPTVTREDLYDKGKLVLKDLESLKENKKNLKKSVKKGKKKLKELKKELDKAENKVIKKKKAYEKAQNKLDNLKRKIEDKS